MDPILKAALSSWDWRPSVIFTLLSAGMLFITGWRRLRRRTSKVQHAGDGWQVAAVWRPISYLAGLVFIGLALMSPLDVLSSQLFSMHMIQHLLLIMIAPPLLLIANPMPIMLWGLPRKWRLKIGRGLARLLNGKSIFRQYLRKATTPGVVWMIWLVAIIGWHDPNAYNAALRSNFVHDIEHLTFFFGGMLFWWHVTGAGPRIHKQFGLIGRTAFALSAVPPNMLTGAVIAFAQEPIYTYYTNVPRLMGLSVMEDQQLSGVIMWVPGSMMYIIAALVLISRLLQGESRKPPLPEASWGSDEALIAPGLKK
ncbi:MAG: cytochrome c oxidase assembly protein [Ardenticatenaceae bacterium]|nr:cytochrome c oxidase assembly protein [Ardenticatenaceae bacterium]MCB9444288.1 cytochrome c oxidase assembly protein [Ardenticatenaceae bacterium]